MRKKTSMQGKKNKTFKKKRFFSDVLSRINVPSRNLASLGKKLAMRKLNQRKVRWIVKQWDLGELSHWSIA
ncbi:MAG: hypothetical protein V1494_07330, partial [Candidatus Diapherotrites archaeon]